MPVDQWDNLEGRGGTRGVASNLIGPVAKWLSPNENVPGIQVGLRFLPMALDLTLYLESDAGQYDSGYSLAAVWDD